MNDHEERYHTLFDLAPIGVYACDSSGLILEFNHCAAELWGRKPVAGDPNERFCGSFKMLKPNGSQIPHAQCPVADVLSGKISTVRDGEMILERPDGSRISVIVNIAPLKNQGGEITGAINCFYDITERQQGIEALQDSEVRYRRLFEAAHDGILILKTSTRRITDVNPFMLELLDFPREHFIGKELWEIGIFRDKEANQRAMQELHDNGSIRFEDLPLQDRNGHRHAVEIVANIYQEGRDSVIQCNIRDIGDRVQFELERQALMVNEQASRLEAEAASRSKDLFLATLSHEVRTPLNAILGWASIIRGGHCNEADLKEGMEVIERNCSVQAKLIEDVLDISRIVSGKLRLEIRGCELVDIIKAAVDVVRPAAEARQIRIETDLDESASHVSCDAGRIQQVVWNLLTNAVKFTPSGKTVRVTLVREHSTARIRVTDEGQGISPDFLPFVFDRFRQADNTTRRRLGGLGLGLSIVKHIVQAHGGTVHADSEGEGRGATFTINLPVRAVRLNEGDDEMGINRDHARMPHLVEARLDGLKVLVVDDEPDARRLLARVLDGVGASVTAVGSAAEAMSAIVDGPPDVLVSDIAMPGTDGYDLIRQVRGIGLTAKDLPAVAVTAFAHQDDRMRAMLAGFQVHVPKPVDPYDLTAIIATLAGRTGIPA
jgi:PAS domain S-box-containing protein